jgi:hypothetical protein
VSAARERDHDLGSADEDRALALDEVAVELRGIAVLKAA